MDAGHDNFKTSLSYSQYISAWYAYMELLDINFSEGFQCSKCGPSPNLIVMDATALSFRRQLDFWSNILLKDEESKMTIPRKSWYNA